MRTSFSDFIVILFLIMVKGFWAFLFIIFCIDSCISEDDPDNSMNAAVELFPDVYIRDSTGNGFRVVYATAGAVTKERYYEMHSSKSYRRMIDSLQAAAMNHFNGDLLNADLVEFARLAVNYTEPDMSMHNIFCTGKEKMEFYLRPNPEIPGSENLWLNYETEQGNQYLKWEDIHIHIPNDSVIYRYWRCPVLHRYSNTDERFAHFSKDDIIE